MIHHSRFHKRKVHLFQTINHLTRYKRRVSVDFNWPEWRGKISWIIRRLHVASSIFHPWQKVDLAALRPRSGMWSNRRYRHRLCKSHLWSFNTPRGNLVSTPDFLSKKIRSCRGGSSSSPFRCESGDVVRGYIRFRVEFRCKKSTAESPLDRGSMISIWIAFDEFHTILVTVGWKVARVGSPILQQLRHALRLSTCTACHDVQSWNVGKHDRICYVIVFFHF